MMKHSSRQFGDQKFQDLVVKMKVLVALGPVLGGISRPVTFSADQMRSKTNPSFPAL